MIDSQMLHDNLDMIEEHHLGDQGFKEFIDENQDIINSLNPNLPLRDYQFNAIGRFIYYMKQYRKKQMPYHLLFNMATGAGKTLIMAATMLYLYKQGYRNFIFFTHLSNIIGKTKDNFLNSQSSKYLFAQDMNIAGQRVSINEVNNFGSPADRDINIMFITMAGLHSLWQNPKEDNLAPEDLDDKKIVLLGDEAHHFSARTKKLNKDQLKENKTWEHTILGNFDEDMGNLNPGLLYVNPLNENILLEFTATIDWEDPKILDKYKDRVIYRYDLRKFRQDKYSKEVNVMQVQAHYVDRALAAVVLSQYRLKIAQRYEISPRPIKPVILFKSNQVNEPKDKSKTSGSNPTVVVSNVFKEKFHNRINNLKVRDLERIKNLALSTDNSDSDGSKNLRKAFEFFAEQNISLSNLVKEIQQDFAIENCLSVDTKDDTKNKQLLLNSLEDETNNIRAIFGTQKLNEGWDVLNLFDIVRLYDSRSIVDGKPGPATNQEAQLIGRGARYCPFTTDGHPDEKYKRKYDDEPDNPLAALEMLHYHCTNNSKYINELNRAMIDQGVKEPKQAPYIIEPKKDIPKIPTGDGEKDAEDSTGTKWEDGSIFLNEQEPRPKEQAGYALGEAILDAGMDGITLKSISISMKEEVLAEAGEDNSANENRKQIMFSVRDLGDNVLRQAADYDPRTNLANLKEKFDGVDSMSAFIELIKENTGKFRAMTHKKDVKELTQNEKLNLAKEILEKIFRNLFRYKPTYVGSTEFNHHFLGAVFGEPKQRSSLPNKDVERATYSQADIDRLVANEWFAQTEFRNATDQEVAFLRFIEEKYAEIQKIYEYFLLFRNDGHFKIYNFANEDKAHEGAATAPDFALFFKQKSAKHYITHQLFVEAKGPQFLDSSGKSFKGGNQGWKEDFLESIVKKAKINAKDKSINLLGAPFFHRKIGGEGSLIPYDKFNEYFENNFISTDKKRDSK